MSTGFLRPPGRGSGLVLFLTAGDPPLAALPEVAGALDESGVDCLELAVPFPESVTDGPVVRRSLARALAAGVDLEAVTEAAAALRPQLHHLRLVLLADWRHSVAPAPVGRWVERVAGAVDATLVHGLPPRLAPAYLDAAGAAGLPVVTTCYPTSSPEVAGRAAAAATAYLYLAAHRGRTGERPPAGYAALAPAVRRARARAPVAVGFGVRTRADVAAVRSTGADGVIVGSAAVARAEEAAARGRDVAAALAALAVELVG